MQQSPHVEVGFPIDVPWDSPTPPRKWMPRWKRWLIFENAGEPSRPVTIAASLDV